MLGNCDSNINLTYFAGFNSRMPAFPLPGRRDHGRPRLALLPRLRLPSPRSSAEVALTITSTPGYGNSTWVDECGFGENRHGGRSGLATWESIVRCLSSRQSPSSLACKPDIPHHLSRYWFLVRGDEAAASGCHPLGLEENRRPGRHRSARRPNWANPRRLSLATAATVCTVGTIAGPEPLRRTRPLTSRSSHDKCLLPGRHVAYPDGTFISFSLLQ
jgi:hypothetical protein